MRQSVQMSLLNRAVAEAKALAKEVDGALAAAANKEEPGMMAPEMAAKMLAKYKKDLATEEIQTYATVTAFKLAEKIDALAKGLGNQGPVRLMEAVRKLGDEFVAVRSQAANAKLGFAAITDESEKAEALLKNDMFKKNASELAAAKRAELAALVADGRFEGGFKASLDAIRALTVELAAMLKDPANVLGVPVRIQAGKDAAVEAARAKEIDHEKWKAQLDVVDKLLGTIKAVDPREIEGLKTTLEETKKATSKSGDYAFGREQLQSIRTRLGLLQANPFGLVITARGKLVQVNNAWRGAVLGFGKALDAVQKKLAETDLPEPDKKAVGQELAELRGLFNPAAFDGPVGIMKDAGKNDEKMRSGQRELGLREARKMLAYIETDYRMRELSNNPFVGDTATATSRLELTLLDLENNMLVSL